MDIDDLALSGHGPLEPAGLGKAVREGAEDFDLLLPVIAVTVQPPGKFSCVGSGGQGTIIGVRGGVLQAERGDRMRCGCEVFVGAVGEEVSIDRCGLLEVGDACRWPLAVDSPPELQQTAGQSRQSGAGLLASQRPCLGDRLLGDRLTPHRSSPLVSCDW
ncbi:hypothetical protein [Streptomyces anulatus]|uniref:hypothetical protein n=1 Tax=Streptomyces anulatus TaxID=1892 RepID=UPI003867F892